MSTSTPSVIRTEPKQRLASAGLPAAAQWLLFIVLSGVILTAFFAMPAVRGLGTLSPILYFHVPMAWNGGLGLMVAGLFSAVYLKTRRIEWDTRAAAAAELGLLFCVLATVTGSLWARGAWNSWWNWDPKETSIFLLILIYGAYFALRGAVEARPARAGLSAAYALLSVATVPILMHIVPYYFERMGESNHPYAVREGKMDGRMLTLLLVSTAAFTLLYTWMFQLRVAVGRIEDVREEGE